VAFGIHKLIVILGSTSSMHRWWSCFFVWLKSWMDDDDLVP